MTSIHAGFISINLFYYVCYYLKANDHGIELPTPPPPKVSYYWLLLSELF